MLATRQKKILNYIKRQLRTCFHLRLEDLTSGPKDTKDLVSPKLQWAGLIWSYDHCDRQDCCDHTEQVSSDSSGCNHGRWGKNEFSLDYRRFRDCRDHCNDKNTRIYWVCVGSRPFRIRGRPVKTGRREMEREIASIDSSRKRQTNAVL